MPLPQPAPAACGATWPLVDAPQSRRGPGHLLLDCKTEPSSECLALKSWSAATEFCGLRVAHLGEILEQKIPSSCFLFFLGDFPAFRGFSRPPEALFSRFRGLPRPLEACLYNTNFGAPNAGRAFDSTRLPPNRILVRNSPSHGQEPQPSPPHRTARLHCVSRGLMEQIKLKL